MFRIYFVCIIFPEIQQIIYYSRSRPPIAETWMGPMMTAVVRVGHVKQWVG